MARQVVVLGERTAPPPVEDPKAVALRARKAAAAKARKAALAKRPTRKPRVRDRHASSDRQQRRRDLLIIARKDFAFYTQGYHAAVEARREAAYRAQRAGLTDREIGRLLGISPTVVRTLANAYVRARTRRNHT